MYSSLSSDNCPIGAQVWQVFMRNHTGTTSGIPGLPVTDPAGASLPGWRLPSHVQQHSALSTSWCFDLCMVLRTLSSYGDRFFAAAGPRLLSTLPVQLCNPDITCGLFRWQLKGHFFGKHEHGALTLLIRGAIEKHLLTYSISQRIQPQKTENLRFLSRERERERDCDLDRRFLSRDRECRLSLLRDLFCSRRLLLLRESWPENTRHITTVNTESWRHIGQIMPPSKHTHLCWLNCGCLLGR